jgi:hypothetical protein
MTVQEMIDHETIGHRMIAHPGRGMMIPNQQKSGSRRRMREASLQLMLRHGE